MRLAKSIYYGGQLISAEDIDYSDYKHLALICPECNEAVYLQRESIRISGGKSVLVRSHYKHFEIKDPVLAKQCDQRVDSYSQEDIQRKAGQARNQRLKVFQQHFWRVFSGHYPPEQFDIENIISAAKQAYFIEKIALNYLTEESIEQIKHPYRIGTIKAMIQNIIASEGYMFLCHDKYFEGHRVASFEEIRKLGFPGIIPCQQLQSKFIKSIRSKLDVKMQELIVNEVLDFLVTRSAYPILQNLVRLGSYLIIDALLDDTKFGFTGWDGNQIVYPYQYEGIEAAQINYNFWETRKNKEIFHFYCLGHIYLLICIFPWSLLMKELAKK